MNKNARILGAVAVAGIVATTGSAYTAGNTVAASSAGFGTTAISPYTTSNVQFDANDTTPTNLDAVTFTLDKTARYVALRTHSVGSWFKSDDARLGVGVHSCTSANGAGIIWTCNVTGATPNETVAGADSLSVVATT